jgi:hypothetical protein
MRQIYTSPRNENVDRVVALLREAGIETTITNRRAYQGHDYKGPSYTAKVDSSTWPQVWVVHAEDQTRARALLREVGVEPAVRFAEEVAQSREKENTPQKRRLSFAWSARTILLIVIILVLALNALGIFKLF